MLKSTNEKLKTKIFIFGKGGIRTPGDRKATLVFKTRAFNHSATFPKPIFLFIITIFLFKNQLQNFWVIFKLFFELC